MIAAATSGPRVSLFDREARDGFTVGGNETNMFDEANRRAAEERAEAEELLRELGLLAEAAERSQDCPVFRAVPANAPSLPTVI